MFRSNIMPFCFISYLSLYSQFHLKACEYKPEPCEQCKELVPAKFMGEHLKKECRRRPVQCEYCSADLEFCQVKVC